MMSQEEKYHLIEHPDEILKKLPSNKMPMWIALAASILSLLLSLLLLLYIIGLLPENLFKLPNSLTDESENDALVTDSPQEDIALDMDNPVDPGELCSDCLTEDIYYLEVSYPSVLYISDETYLPLEVRLLKNGLPLSGEQIEISIANIDLLNENADANQISATDQTGKTEFTLLLKPFSLIQREQAMVINIHSSIADRIIAVQMINAQTLFDNDLDGLSDEKELELGTDSNRVDTDGDNYSDYVEVFELKTNPLENNWYVVDVPNLEVLADDATTILGYLSYLSPVFYFSETDEFQSFFFDFIADNEDIQRDNLGVSIKPGSVLRHAENDYAVFSAENTTPIRVIEAVDEQHSLVRVFGQARILEDLRVLRNASICISSQPEVLNNGDGEISLEAVVKGEVITLGVQGDCGVGSWTYSLNDKFNGEQAVILQETGSSPGSVNLQIDTSTMALGEHEITLSIGNSEIKGTKAAESDPLIITIIAAEETEAEEPVPESSQPAHEAVVSAQQVLALPTRNLNTSCNLLTTEQLTALLFDLPIGRLVYLDEVGNLEALNESYLGVFVSGYINSSMVNQGEGILNDEANRGQFFMGDPSTEGAFRQLGDEVSGMQVILAENANVEFQDVEYIKVYLQGVVEAVCLTP